MTIQPFFHIAGGLFVVAGAIGGCDRSSGPITIPIRGEVLYEGQPLKEGLVVYLPKNSDDSRQASGKIEANGSFVLTTFKKGDGVVPGEYAIVVYPYDSPAGAERTREQIEAAAQTGAPRPASMIPERYSDPVASGLTDTVNDEHSGVKQFVLTD